MNYRRLFSTIARSVTAIALCLTLAFSHASPSLAVSSYGSSNSAKTEATDQLTGIQKQTDRVAASAPLNREQTQARSEKGLNEVQADADKDKMYRSSNSQDATTVKEQVEDFLGNITGGN